MLVHPTHTCFDDSLDYIEYMIENKKSLKGYFLTHALLEIPKTNFIGITSNGLYAHSWLVDSKEAAVIVGGVVEGEKVFLHIDIDEYYNDIKIYDMTIYSIREALELNHKTGHYGPWKESYKEYCR